MPYRGRRDVSEQWWDWTGVGWMASENPLLVIDSRLPNVIGESPRTIWFVPDAHHSIPFQLIQSNGTYEAPPRFRARIEHDGDWNTENRNWTTRPTWYKVHLYEDRLAYTFVPIRDDVPPNQFEDGYQDGSPDGFCTSTNIHGEPLTLHDRPYLPQDIPDQATAESWEPFATTQNPGLGIPHFGICTRIEDQYGHRADIYYCDVPTSTLEDAGPGGCDTCWEDSQRLGQINYVKLRATDGQGGYETAWTLVYAHRRFRGAATSITSALVNGHSTDKDLTYLLSLLDPTGELGFSDVFPEIEANAALYSLRGSTAIDRIYAFAGDVPESDVGPAQLTISHLDQPMLNGGVDPLAEHNSGGGSLPTDWRYMVRYHYEYEERSLGSAWPFYGNGQNLTPPLLVKTTVETAGLGLTDRRAYHYRDPYGGNDQRKFQTIGMHDIENEWFPWLELLFEDQDISRVEAELGLTIDEVARWRTNATEDFDEDSGIDAEEVRALASLRLNARPVNEDNDRVIPSGDSRWSEIGDWAKPGHNHLFRSDAHGQYLVNDRSSVVNGEPYLGDPGIESPQEEASSMVAMATINRDDGSTAHYALHKLVHLPKQYSSAEPSVGWDYYFNSVSYRHASSVAHPFRWYGYPHITYEGPWVLLTNDAGEIFNAQGDFCDGGNLALARWISIVDAFDTRAEMVDSTVSYDSVCFKPGLRHRSVMEMNPAGYLLRNREWYYTDTGVDFDASGLGEEFIFVAGEDYDGFTLPTDPNGAPAGEETGWADALDSIRNELLLIEHRSIGWSAAARMDESPSTTNGDTRGMVSFYEYELYDGPGVPPCEWIQRSAAGIKQGRAYIWDTGTGNITANTAGGPRLYQRQYFRDATNPGQITTEIEFLTPELSLLGAEPQVGQVVSDDFAVRSIKSFWAPGDDDQLASRLVVGPGRRARPGGPFLFPVEREFYDNCGNTTWSFTGFVRDPESPATEQNPEPDEILMATYYHGRDGFGRARHTILDAESGATLPAEFGPGVDDNGPDIVIPGPPDTGWSRIGATSALNHVTSFKYDPFSEQLTDIFFPSGRRWAKRSVRWDILDENDEIIDFFIREYVFSELEYVRSDPVGQGEIHIYRTSARGEINDLPTGTLDTLATPITRRDVEFVDPSTEDLIEFDVDFRLQEGAPGFGADELDDVVTIAAQADLVPDQNGRLTRAELLEPDATGALRAVGSKEVNDLGEIFREYDFDGTITRLTRNPIGQPLRTYIGTDDLTWTSNPQGTDMVLVERIEYGSGINDAWKPTVTRKYRSQPSWAYDYHDTPPSTDNDGIATVTRYDWRGRPVRIDVHAMGEPSAANRQMTTLTYYDHGDRVVMTATYGAGTLSIPSGDDPELIDDDDPLPSVADLYAFGVQPLSVTESIYDNTGNAYETREYDTAWSTGTQLPVPHQGHYSFAGYKGAIVYSAGPSQPLRRVVLDAVGRVASEIDHDLIEEYDPDADNRELTRTDYIYDTDGNTIDIRTFVRTEANDDLLVATGAGANSVRTRVLRWFDRHKRIVAEADMGTEQADWVSGPLTPAVLFEYDPDAPPLWDEASGVDRKGLPASVRLWIWQYDSGNGETKIQVDPAGVVTEFVYSNAGRLQTKIENAYASSESLKRVTEYEYKLGRLVGMITPRRIAGSETEGEHLEATYISYGAPIVDDTFTEVSRHNGLVGEVYVRQDGDIEPVLEGSPAWHASIDPDMELAYTFEGRVAVRNDARDLTFLYRYDDLGRLSSIEVGHGGIGAYAQGYPSGFWLGASAPSDPVTYVEFAYDEDSLLTDVIARDAPQGSIISHVQRDYDDYGMLTDEWQQLDAMVDTLSSPAVSYEWEYQPTSNAYAQRFLYVNPSQPAGPLEPGHHRLESITYPDQSTIATMDYGAQDSTEDLLSRVVGMDVSSGPGSWRAADFARAGDGRRLVSTFGDGNIIQDFAADTPGGTAGASGLDRFGAAKDLHFKNSNGDTLYRSRQKYDVRGNLRSMWIDQESTPTDPAGGERSQVFGYDDLNRLVTADMGQIVFAMYTGEPSIHPNGLFRSDTWTYDSVGNWSGTQHWADYNGDDSLTNDDVIPFLTLWQAEDPSTDVAPPYGVWDTADVTAFQQAIIDDDETPGRHSFGNLDGYGTEHLEASADSIDDVFQFTQHLNADNSLLHSISRESDGGPVHTRIDYEYDAAGNLTFDGRYYYEYDAWCRLIRVLKADDNGQGVFTPGDMVRDHTYDGLGRLVRTRAPLDGNPASGTHVQEFYYDGARRIQERFGEQGSTISIERDYVWGVGDAGMDELIVQIDAYGAAWWSIQNSAGDIVALCDLGGANGDARVVGQWSYDPYGEVVLAEQLHAFPVQHVGHKGMFIDVLDRYPDVSTEPRRLVPFAHAMYQYRNRAYVPTYGRFLQRDPNQTAMQLLGESYGGRGTGAIAVAFSMEGWYGDGFNLYQYLGSNPLLRRDPMGLSYDPFDMVDDYLAESAGNRAAFLSKLGKGALAAATTAATIASWLPIPGVSQLGDVALYALGEQSAEATAVALTLGLVPGGKLAGKLGGFISKIGASAWKSAKHYAKLGANFLLKRYLKPAVGLVGELASRAKRFIDDVCGCFEAGTLVWTLRGLVPIEQISVDDHVLAMDESSGSTSIRRVTQTFVREAAPIIAIGITTGTGAGETIRTTEEHPFYVPGTGWVEAGMLEPSNQIVSSGNPPSTVVSVSFTGQRRTVFNFEVEGLHNYRVGVTGLLVHNPACKLNVSSKVPTSQLKYKPRERGQAPFGLDGKRIELHHPNSNRPFDVREMTFTDHRGGGTGNSAQNHPPPWNGMTPEDRQIYDAERRLYWSEQWDSGRFSGLPERP